MPNLYVFAGPNGSGKSFFSDSLLELEDVGLRSFDYDLEFEKRWSKYDYDSVVEAGVRDSTTQYFEHCYKGALKLGKHFAFQTNFNSADQINIVDEFRRAGYELELVYFYVKDIAILLDRIEYRFKAKQLHFVPELVVKERYKSGLQMVNKHHSIFDKLTILDNTRSLFDDEMVLIPEPIYVRNNGETVTSNSFPTEIFNFT